MLQHGDMEKGREILEHLSNGNNPKTKDASKVSLSMYWWMKGDLDKAIELSEKALENGCKDKNLYVNLCTYLLEKGSIETTVTRAKEVRSMAEKMITLGKEATLHNKRQALAYITKEDVVKKLFDELGPKYKDVNGGYCRIIKTGPRRGDAAEMCIIELV